MKDKISNFSSGLYDKEQFLNNMRFNFSQITPPEETKTHYFNNSYIVNLGHFIDDMEI